MRLRELSTRCGQVAKHQQEVGVPCVKVVTLFEDSVDTKWMLSADGSVRSTGEEEGTRGKG